MTNTIMSKTIKNAAKTMFAGAALAGTIATTVPAHAQYGSNCGPSTRRACEYRQGVREREDMENRDYERRGHMQPIPPDRGTQRRDFYCTNCTRSYEGPR
jgi:hypothetical protein